MKTEKEELQERKDFEEFLQSIGIDPKTIFKTEKVEIVWENDDEQEAA